MPGDFITDDIDTMLQTSEFATEVTYDVTNTININFNPEEILIDPSTGEQTAIAPMGWAKTEDVPGIKNKKVFIINSENYEVQKAFDNLGVTEITFHRLNT
jgi:hypothetical protein